MSDLETQLRELQERVDHISQRLACWETLFTSERELERLLARIECCQNEERLESLRVQLHSTKVRHQSALNAVYAR